MNESPLLCIAGDVAVEYALGLFGTIFVVGVEIDKVTGFKCK